MTNFHNLKTRFPAILVLSLVCGGPAAACSCIAFTGSTLDRANATDKVFHGRIVDIYKDRRRPGIWIDFETGAWWGDGVPTDEVTVVTSNAGCGLEELEIGAEFIIYANKRDGELRVGACGGSTRHVEAERARLGTPVHDLGLQKRKRSPAEAAIVDGDVGALGRALADGADPSEKTPDGRLADLAIAKCDVELVAALAAGGGKSHPASVFRCPQAQWARLLEAQDHGSKFLGQAMAKSVRDGPIEQIHALLAAGADPDVDIPRGGLDTALGAAFRHGKEAAWKLLLSRGAEIDRRALAGAAASESEEARKFVLDAQLNADDASYVMQRSPAHPEVVSHLLALGARPNGMPRMRTPLLEATIRRGWESAEMLVYAGATPTQGTLEAAVSNDALGLVRAMLASGIRPESQALLLARQPGHELILRAFETVGGSAVDATPD